MSSVDVDPYDEKDAIATEAALALAIQQVLSTPVDARGLDKRRAGRILDSTVRNSLSHYSQRVLARFNEEYRRLAGRTQIVVPDYELLQVTVKKAVDKVIGDTAESVVEIAESAKRIETAPSPSATYEQGLHEAQAEAFSRLKTGMESVSRVLTTRTREESKLAYAVALGALGSVWHTRKDDKVRLVHADLEGHFERIGDAFPEINGDRLMYPGDPNAPLRSTINCRCRLSYRMPVGEG